MTFQSSWFNLTPSFFGLVMKLHSAQVLNILKASTFESDCYLTKEMLDVVKLINKVVESGKMWKFILYFCSESR
jgi:hypothetical protein